MKDGLTCFRKIMYTGALFRGYPRDQSKCPLNGGWAGVCLLFTKKLNIFYSVSELASVIFLNS